MSNHFQHLLCSSSRLAPVAFSPALVSSAPPLASPLLLLLVPAASSPSLAFYRLGLTLRLLRPCPTSLWPRPELISVRFAPRVAPCATPASRSAFLLLAPAPPLLLLMQRHTSSSSASSPRTPASTPHSPQAHLTSRSAIGLTQCLRFALPRLTASLCAAPPPPQPNLHSSLVPLLLIGALCSSTTFPPRLQWWPWASMLVRQGPWTDNSPTTLHQAESSRECTPATD